MDTPHRRRFLAAVSGLSSFGLAGCSLFSNGQSEPDSETLTTGTETEPAVATSDFTDDFDYRSEELSDNGWTIANQGIGIDDSYLTTTADEAYQWIYRPITGTGRYFVDGGRNPADRDLRIVLSPEEPSGNVYDGYQLVVKGAASPYGDSDDRAGNVFLARRDGQIDQTLLNNDYQHDAGYHNYEITREADGTMAVSIDGERYGTTSDDAISEIEYLGIRFDQTSQRLDKVGHVS